MLAPNGLPLSFPSPARRQSRLRQENEPLGPARSRTSAPDSCRVRPLVSAGRTASRRNSGVGLFPFSIEHLLVPRLVLSTFPGQVQFTPKRSVRSCALSSSMNGGRGVLERPPTPARSSTPRSSCSRG